MPRGGVNGELAPAYQPAGDAYLELGAVVAAGAGVATDDCDFFDSLDQ